MKKHLIQTAVILAAVSAFGLTACAQGSTSAPIPDTLKVENVKDHVITVQSSEEVKVVPDMAELVFSVTTQAEDAKACQEQNSRDLANVISFLKDSGIAETSIQTSNYVSCLAILPVIASSSIPYSFDSCILSGNIPKKFPIPQDGSKIFPLRNPKLSST